METKRWCCRSVCACPKNSVQLYHAWDFVHEVSLHSHVQNIRITLQDVKTCKFALPEMIQQKCHHKHQSPWPQSTQNTNPWTEDVSLVVSDWQTYKQSHLWYCSSWTWGTWHLCHFTTILISPMFSLPRALHLVPSLPVWLPAHLLSVHSRITSLLNAHVAAIHTFKFFTFFFFGFQWIAYFLPPTPYFLSSSTSLTQIREKGNTRNTNGKEEGVRVFRLWWNRLGESILLSM